MAAYDTYTNADTYFTARLYVQDWTDAPSTTKTKALTEASQRIDRLRFRGEKVSDTQDLEFPRYYDVDEGPDGTEVIPDDIKIACYERNPENEIEGLAVLRRSFSNVSTTYRNDAVLEHLASGIPSILAWQYLKPYLAYCKSINVYRKS
jgi:hypothetical protein